MPIHAVRLHFLPSTLCSPIHQGYCHHIEISKQENEPSLGSFIYLVGVLTERLGEGWILLGRLHFPTKKSQG
jgi:hypothetical protein